MVCVVCRSLRRLRLRHLAAGGSVVAVGLVVSALVSLTAGAQEVRIRGIVRDAASNPVPFANIHVGGTRRGIADDSGYFALAAAAHRELVLEIRRIGFKPERVVLTPSTDTSLQIVLATVATILPREVIAATQPRKSLLLSGFYRRMQEREKGINAGHFLTEEDIERRNPLKLTRMLEGLPSVRVTRFNTQEAPRSLLGSGVATTQCYTDSDPDCQVPAGLNQCPMVVYVDGRRINSLAAGKGVGYAFGLDGLVQPSAVAGIEVYPLAGRVPPEFQSLAGTCGAILIWTK